MAQQSTVIKGVVTDVGNNPIGGVNVLVKGTHKGAVTDEDGRYSIAVKNADVVLLFSYSGFTTKEVAVGDSRQINVTLSSKTNQLNEVVVTGYGQSSKKDITGSVASISKDEFNVGVFSTPAQLLQGKVAGLDVTKSGDPNAQPVVILRGASTLRAGAAQQPFYVIDGVPDASIDLVSPEDIASIDVLKDASATAIYGARAANGVIMITTRKPKPGTSRLAYNSYVAVETVSKKIDMLSGDELRAYLVKNGNPLVQGNTNGNFDDSLANTNWQDQVERVGITQNQNLYFGASTGQTTLGASINYMDQQGIMKGSDLQRTAIRANLEHRMFNDRLKLGLTVLNTQSTSDQIPSEVYENMLKFMPTLNVKEAGGAYSSEYQYGLLNPVALIKDRKSVV